jgi:anti-sigma regulatory factor (Ser/Thr protein kinase)
MDDRKSIELTNEIMELGRLTRFVDDVGEEWNIPDRVMFNINLALDELVTNIINYGYSAKGMPIHIFFSRDDDVVSIRIEDYGAPFNPVESPEPDTGLALEDRTIGGLGIHFVKTLMDSMDYERNGDRNILTLTIDIARPRD